MKREILSQLYALIETGWRLTESFKLNRLEFKSDAPEAELRAFVTTSLAAIERIVGTGSHYYKCIPQ